MIPADPGRCGDQYAEWDAAYVLGALSPSDRRAYERHLAECDACRSAVAELAGMPGLLSVLTPAHAEALVAEAPGAELSDGGGPAPYGDGPDPAPVVSLASLAGAARRSRTRRRSLTAVAASVLVAVGAVGGSVLAGSDLFGVPDGAGTPPSAAVAAARTIELRPVGDADMRAELIVTPTTWGTSLRWSCHYPPEPGQQPDATYAPAEPIRYELVLVGRDGARTVAGTWSWSGGATTGLDASSAVPLTDVDRIEITLDGHEEALASATL
ncbi:putative zinc-finger [Promicromonospora umidemergens]|uniref:Zf-HC2 domain-containing protein n=1 Tax=Promicromonospora umidemergens TaxID=629679 RepID=A0ABP8X8I2_9MICO|nr:zf-HC2 domain-containing protein [Promicromonospora umidemergens]MCP2281231.1 putative zinc-finger [Promicromonospora umidemergens]